VRRKPKRLYTANDMADGVSAVHQLGLAAIKINPAASGPLAAVPTLGGAGSGPGPVELLEAHCHGCQCLQGDALIIVNRGGKSSPMKLRDVVHRFNGLNNGRSGRSWDLDIPTFVQQARDGAVRLVELSSAWSSGRKETFVITTETGRSIRATTDHPFSTPSGWTVLGNLDAGRHVHVQGEKATGTPWKPNLRYKRVFGMKNHPYANYWKPNKATGEKFVVNQHRLVAEATLNGLDYEDFIQMIRIGETDNLRFIDPSVWTVHHLDEDHTNNEPANLKVITHREHGRIHGLENPSRVIAKVTSEKILSIVHFGFEMTYDIEVVTEPHNFLANGFVVHNSKKMFQVEGTDTMANGALRKYGKGVCGHKLSTFVSGATNG
jgi:hypothetical protein